MKISIKDFFSKYDQIRSFQLVKSQKTLFYTNKSIVFIVI